MRERRIPQSDLSCVAFDKESSMQFVADFFVEGRGIRFCHFESGRSCYRYGHTAFPAHDRKFQDIRSLKEIQVQFRDAQGLCRIHGRGYGNT